MDWKRLISAKRLGMEGIESVHKDDRSAFLRDYDRLIFSAPFRRLQNKTQVFPLPGSVFVHNRLTHSLEVACVGRSLGNNVSRALIKKRPELADTNIQEIGNIVSAACLAHDMGIRQRPQLVALQSLRQQPAPDVQCHRQRHARCPALG